MSCLLPNGQSLSSGYRNTRWQSFKRDEALNGVYTQLYNKRHDRVGHVFQGRYKAILVSKESHLLETCGYVVLNPVRAKVIGTLGQWKWSSYRGTAGFDKPHPCLTIDCMLIIQQ